MSPSLIGMRDAGGKRSDIVLGDFIQASASAAACIQESAEAVDAESVPDPRTRGSVFQESASGIAGGFGFGSSLRMI
jgi:hypothetical protein